MIFVSENILLSDVDQTKTDALVLYLSFVYVFIYLLFLLNVFNGGSYLKGYTHFLPLKPLHGAMIRRGGVAKGGRGDRPHYHLLAK